MLQSRQLVCLLITCLFVESIYAQRSLSPSLLPQTAAPRPAAAFQLGDAVGDTGLNAHGKPAWCQQLQHRQQSEGGWFGFGVFFPFPAFTKHQRLAGDEKPETTEAKNTASASESRQKRIPCPAWHASFGLGFCLYPAELRVRLASTSRAVRYGKEHFKATAAATPIRPSLQMGGAEAAPVRAERAVGRVRSACLAAGFSASLWKCTRTHSSSAWL